MKHLVFFSGGMGSFATTYRILNDKRWDVDVNDLRLLFTDTQIEDKTLYKFLMQSCQFLFKKDATDLIDRLENLTETHVDLQKRKNELKDISIEAGKRFPQFVWLRYEFEGNPISPWDIFYNEKFIGNSRVANCSKILKQRMAKDYILENYKKDDVKVYLGIDWSESHRRNAPVENWKPYTTGVEFPLCEEPYVDREYKIELLKECKIDLPKLYELGFEHNNCGGFCVRAGQGHFRQLYLTKPELFNYHANEEKKLMEIIKDYKGDDTARYSILKKTRKGVVYQLPLESLREMIHQESDEIDKTEMGGCGCFVTDDMNDEDQYEGKKWGIRDLDLIAN